MMAMKKSPTYARLEKQEERIEDKKKKVKAAEMENMIRSIVRSELARAKRGK